MEPRMHTDAITQGARRDRDMKQKMVSGRDALRVGAHRQGDRKPIRVHPCSSAVSLLLIVIALTGCDTIKQDFELFSKSIFPPTPAEAARMMIDPYNADNRREGTVLIANSPFGGVDVYVRAYRDRLIDEPDPTVRAVAIRALARHGTPDDAVLIARELRHENDQVRREAALGLQRLHNPAVVPDLLAALRNAEERADVRAAAAEALGQYPQDRVFQGLIGAMDARELSVNLAAERSLATITGEALGQDAREWFRWYASSPPSERFAGQRDYLYPTYQRSPTIFERIAFWNTPRFEQPAPPAGVVASTRRTTYGEDANQDSR
jgi:hypothetical protein